MLIFSSNKFYNFIVFHKYFDKMERIPTEVCFRQLTMPYGNLEAK